MAKPKIDLAAIQSLDRSELLNMWKQMFGCPPGAHISVKLMRSMLSYECQNQTHGGVPPTVMRILRRRAKQIGLQHAVATDRQYRPAKAGDLAAAIATTPVAPALRPGVQLMREWNGRTYRVEVTEDGFRMDGKTYRSLTAIARKVTGAHWSGPRFFGLTNRRAALSDDRSAS